MATPIEDITFLARTGRSLTGISGADITLPASVTAEGLSKNGNISIDALGGTTRTLLIGNSTPGQVCDVSCDGHAEFASYVAGLGIISYLGDVTVRRNPGTGFGGSLTGTFTAARTLTLPDFDGNVVVTSTTNVNTGRIMVSGNVHLQDNGSTQAIQLTGAPTSNRAVTFPDASGTVVLQDGSGDATVSRWIICNTPFMRGATGTDNMRFNTSGVSGSHAVTIPSKSGTMAVGTPAAAIADLVVGVATVDDCAAAINSILAVLRGFEQVSP